jgi:hypothetical protein
MVSRDNINTSCGGQRPVRPGRVDSFDKIVAMIVLNTYLNIIHTQGGNGGDFGLAGARWFERVQRR